MTELESILGTGSTFQSVFVDSFTHSLDAKRRFSIPTHWRNMISGEPKRLLVLPAVSERCLCVYPADEIQHRIQKLRQMPSGDEKGRDFARVLASRSDLVVVDNQGRVRVKDALLQFAGLTKQVELIGAFDRFELWNPQSWAEKQAGSDDDLFKQASAYVGF